MEQRRLYIGGLSDAVLEKDIKKKFSEFGTVKDVELRCKENYGNRRYFAYINIQADKTNLDNCVRTCNNLEWKGGTLKVQLAKESYLQAVQNDISERKTNLSESETGKKRARKNQPVKRKDSSDESDDDEPKSYLGVPAWRGFKSNAESTQRSPSVSKRDVNSAKQTSKEPEAQQESTTSGVHQRLYIGGLPETALDGDIKAKFAEFGRVKSVEIKCKENYGNKRFFAYVDLDTDESKLDRCIRECNNQTWRGAQLKVQIAKESFLQKAQNEILERKTHGAEPKLPEARESGGKITRANDEHERMDYTNSGEIANDRQRGAYEHEDRREHFNERRNWNDSRDAYPQNRSRNIQNTWGRSGPSDESYGGYNERFNRPGHSRNEESSKRYEGANTFESERNGLFDEIDAADELGLEQDELLSEEDEGKPVQADDINDPLSEKNLKELFDQNTDSKGFTLSSLFADQLTVEEPEFSEEEHEPLTRQPRGEVERYGEEYWKRAERVDQRSWQEMVHKHDRNTFNSRTSSSFFILPGDKRLEEGAEVFRTDKDPAQFVDCWREQAEQLTLRLLQRKRNTRVQYQMAQRAAGMSKQPSGKRKFFRKQIQREAS